MRFLAIPLLLCLGACRSDSDPLERPIPFHVALAPMTDVEVVDSGGARGPEFDVAGAWVERLNEELARELDSRTFVATTRLAAPAPQGRPAPTTRDWLQLASQETGADLLVTFRLRRGTVFRSELNPIITTAAPFCWIPGPHLWPVTDQRYRADCTLTFEVYDLAKYRAVGARSDPSRRRWYFSDAATLENLYIDFFQRVGWNLHIYLVSLILPTLVVPFERDDLDQVLEERAIEKLAEGLSYDLQRRRVDLVRNEVDYSFFLDDEDTRVELEGETQARVRLHLVHRLGNSRNEPESFVLHANDLAEEAVRHDLTWAERDAAYSALPGSRDHAHFLFTELVEISAATRYLKLSVTSGKSPRSTREFSLAVPGRGPAARD
jgi:hypothetical protein